MYTHICVSVHLNHFATHQKLIQHCKPTILQLKKKSKNSKKHHIDKWCLRLVLLSVTSSHYHEFEEVSIPHSEKAMAFHSSTLAWRSPWTEEPGRLQSMGSWRVRHTTEWLHFHFSLFTFIHWRRKWQPTPVFLHGESQRRRSLVGCRLWGRTESDTTEAT